MSDSDELWLGCHLTCGTLIDFDSVPLALKKRAFLALASMVKKEGEYVAAGRDNEPAGGARYEEDIETAVAFQIITDLCRINDISLKDAESDALLVGGRWDDPGSENISLDTILFDL
ncbi:hypothetical protein BV25DRAFT_1840602 [Artomyces pyxidatus]|uniref:Uncharacterized protein n=1 Tax=Artomyces pyxidatus TaxID=48021 RepID=A0ACB8SQY7_9AGAM|nr:hypothetical protein BV25DRAFT_1840602 [Artomyces pyxidatus]